MATGRKINISAYEFTTYTEKDGQREKKIDTVEMRYQLPDILCNPNLSGEPGRPDSSFDLLKIGKIARKIELCPGEELILGNDEYQVLKARSQVISKYFGRGMFEALERIMDAPEVELTEKK